MSHISYRLARAGYTLRTNTTQACRDTFLAGYRRAGMGQFQLWAPMPNSAGYSGNVQLPTDEHVRVAMQIHPDLHSQPRWHMALAGHRVGLVMGADTDQTAEFVVLWTADGCESPRERTTQTGAAITTIMAAHLMGVPVFNLQRTDAAKRIGRFLNEARELRRMAHTMAKSVEEPQDVDSLHRSFPDRADPLPHSRGRQGIR